MTRIRVVQQDQLPDGSRRVILAVEYGAQVAGIELPVPLPLFDREPEVEAYRRGLHALLTAFEKWEKAGGAIEITPAGVG
jgi:hypothetical protein